MITAPNAAQQYEQEAKAGIKVMLTSLAGHIALGVKHATKDWNEKDEKKAVSELRLDPLVHSLTDSETEIGQIQGRGSGWSLQDQVLSSPPSQGLYCWQATPRPQQAKRRRRKGQQLHHQQEEEQQLDRSLSSHVQSNSVPSNPNNVHLFSKRLTHEAKRNKHRRQMKSQAKINSVKLDAKIHNLSKKNIPPEQVQSLVVGTNFIPVPKSDDKVLEDSLFHFVRTSKLKYIHQSEESIMPKWWISKGTNPSSSGSADLDRLLRQFENKIRSLPSQRVLRNYTSKEMSNLRKLLAQKDILVITADKNLGYVIVDQDWYITNSLAHLQNATSYRECTEEFNGQDKGQSTIASIYKSINNLVEKYVDVLDEDEMRWILQPKKWKPMPFYITAKVHKQPVKGRPIIPTQNWVTYNLSKWLAAELNDYVEKSNIILRDSLDLINTLESDEDLKARLEGHKDVWLISADVDALYPNIHTPTGVHFITRHLHRQNHATAERRTFISKALNLVMRENYIAFQDKIYQQTNGTAMGTPLGPQYANLFMEELEHDCVERWRSQGLQLYKRFIDDIFAIFTGTREDAERLMHELSSLHPMIKLTYVISSASVDFLDITISVDMRFTLKGLLSIKVYQKPMNEYLYVPWNSFHTTKQRTGFIKGECIRYARTCSSKDDFYALVKLFKARLLKRGYPVQVIEHGVSQVSYDNRATYLKVKPKDKSIIPLLFKVVNNPRVSHKHLRKELDALERDLTEISGIPQSLKGHITICYKLSKSLHAHVLKARRDKGF